MNSEELKKSFLSGNRRALSRFISLAENGDSSVVELLKDVFAKTGHAKVVGVTGVPGAGKSSLIDQFVSWARGQEKTVCVIAVDPISPFTGGAILGDRIRLVDHSGDNGVFVRSLSTRGKLGGLSLATHQVLHLCEAFGFNYVIVETVGVGQSEVDIHELADLCLLVLGPEAGDSIQTLKSGVFEIADAIAIHKSDRPGSDAVEKDVRAMLELANREQVALLKTSLKQSETLLELWKKLDTLFSSRRPEIEKRRQKRKQKTLFELMRRELLEKLESWISKNAKEHANPYATASELLQGQSLTKLFPQ